MWPFSSSDPPPPLPTTPASCPVDHTKLSNPSPSTPSRSIPPSLTQITPKDLSTDRVISSIPRWLPPSPSSPPSSTPTSPNEPPTACPAHSTSTSKSTSENWVYPSPSSFYTALQRKERNPNPSDMNIVVPIHNAVNEKVWDKVLEWERMELNGPGSGSATSGGGRESESERGALRDVKLVSFVGKPNELSPRARWYSLIGYTPPFDRHDWIIDRPSPSPSSSPLSSSSSSSTRIRYIIDFYTGRGALSSHPMLQGLPKGEQIPNLAFYIDVRPALDSWDGWRLRGKRVWWDLKEGLGFGGGVTKGVGLEGSK